jgi:hypothetical protein
MTVRVCPICDIADCATHRPSTLPAVDPAAIREATLRLDQLARHALTATEANFHRIAAELLRDMARNDPRPDRRKEMSDDLIKRLQYLGRVAKDYDQEHMTSADYEMIPAVTKQAADRIEALEERNKELAQFVFDAGGQAADTLGKLDKAVEIGNKMAASIKGNYYLPNVVAEWNAVLVELECGE